MADTYWRERERKHIEKSLKDDARFVRDLEREYNRSMKEIESQINNFYSWYSSKEGISLNDARMRVRQVDIDAYSALAKEYVRTKNLTETANRQMTLYNLTMKINRLELLQETVRLELIAMSSTEERMLAAEMTKQATAEFARQAGILGQTVATNAQNAALIVNASFQSATFSERIWNNHEALKTELNKLLTNGVVQGRGSRDMIPVIRERFGVSKSNAKRLAQTEFARVQTAVQEKSYQDAGIDKYEYIAQIDNRTSRICKSLDGKIFKLKDMKTGVNSPPMHPFVEAPPPLSWSEWSF